MKTLNQMLNPILIFLIIIVGLSFCYSGCAEINPIVAKRRQLSGRLRSCLREYSGNDIFRQQCIKESVMYCQEAKLESSCAYDDLITDLPKDRP